MLTTSQKDLASAQEKLHLEKEKCAKLASKVVEHKNKNKKLHHLECARESKNEELLCQDKELALAREKLHNAIDRNPEATNIIVSTQAAPVATVQSYSKRNSVVRGATAAKVGTGAATAYAAGSLSSSAGGAADSGYGALAAGPVKTPTSDAEASGAVGFSGAAGIAVGGTGTVKQAKDTVSDANNEDWVAVKGRKQVRLSPKRNPFMVLSDFKAESRFPINRKLEDEEFEAKFRHLSEEQKKVKRQEREMKRLMWTDQARVAPSPAGGTRSQQKKK